MSEVVYVSKSRIERKRGPLRIARLPGEPQPVVYSVHGAIAEHYKVDPLNGHPIQGRLNRRKTQENVATSTLVCSRIGTETVVMVC